MGRELFKMPRAELRKVENRERFLLIIQYNATSFAID
jgi:hypothetical protein